MAIEVIGYITKAFEYFKFNFDDCRYTENHYIEDIILQFFPGHSCTYLLFGS